MLPIRECLYWLLSMSVTGMLTGLAVWLIGRWKRLPRQIAHALWGIPLLRLWLPFGLPSPSSLLNLLPPAAYTPVPVNDSSPLLMMNFVQLADGYLPLTWPDRRTQIVLTVAGWIWLAGALLLAIILLASHLANCRDVAAACHVSRNVYRSTRIGTPAVYGILRPRILIPQDMPEALLPSVLAHENAHIRRMDNLWRLVAVATACLHWFNPAAWLLLKAFLHETEMACDECAISTMDAPARRAYAHALVDTTADNRTLVSPFGGSPLRSRISALCSFRRLTAWSLAAFLALSAALAWALLTNPV